MIKTLGKCILLLILAFSLTWGTLWIFTVVGFEGDFAAIISCSTVIIATIVFCTSKIINEIRELNKK